MACHCRGCQKMSASAFSLSVAIPAEGFAVTGGEPVLGGLHGAQHHHFCPWCKSWIYTRTDGFDWFVNLRPTVIDDAAWFVPFIETFAAEKLAWANTPARHRDPGFPAEEEFPRLLAAFQAL